MLLVGDTELFLSDGKTGTEGLIAKIPPIPAGKCDSPEAMACDCKVRWF